MSEHKPPEPGRESPLHPRAVEGIHLFNSSLYWKAHEALEAAWLDEPGEVRNLYRGILQVGVAYWHVQRANYRGAVKVLLRSQRWLAPFPESCFGIDVEQLRKDADNVLNEIYLLGPGGIAAFDQARLKPLVWMDKKGFLDPNQDGAGRCTV